MFAILPPGQPAWRRFARSDTFAIIKSLENIGGQLVTRNQVVAALVALLVLSAPLEGVRAADDQSTTTALPDNITFSDQIAAFVYKNCTVCHRPGEAAPFSLLSYDDVRKHARSMLWAMTEREMPPWQPEPGYGEFRDERRLSAAQIGLFKAWVESGMMEGDRAKMPKPPDFASGWILGEPDLVVEMAEPFDVPEGGPDIYRNFVLPTGVLQEKWVSAVAFRATAPSVVHHVLYFVDDTGGARKLDGKDGRQGFAGMGFRGSGQLGGWAVGGIPHKLPDGLAYPLPKASDLVVQTHFHPSGKAEKCKLTLALYFATQPPARTLVTFQVPPVYGLLSGIDIPAGKADFSIHDSFTLPIDVDIVSVAPHAHYIGREFKGEAKFPDGTVQPLIWIKDWNFGWQGSYDYKKFIRLPKGTIVRGEVSWDNSDENARNPNIPPIHVRWGEGSNDEMGSLIFRCIAVDEKQLPALKAAIRRHIVESYNAAVKRGDKIDLESLGIKNDVFDKLKNERSNDEKPAEKNQQSSTQKATGDWLEAALASAGIVSCGELPVPSFKTAAKANVLIFLTPDCPISNGYAPEIKAIVNDFKNRPVRFFAVHTDPDLKPEAARRHAHEFGLPVAVLLDSRHELVMHSGATITPEVAVLMPDGEVAYRGRIDDTYPGLGKRRNAPSRRDLREALASILAGAPVAVPRTNAVGCYITDLK
jgi:hypothetical protein